MKRTPLIRKTPMARSGAPARRKGPGGGQSRRLRAEHGMAYPEARRLVHARSGGICERHGCGTPIPLERMEAHHRLTRRFGPDCPCNLLALCSRCHHEKVHGLPELARELGQIISRHSDRPPAEVSAYLRHGEVWLDCSGNFASRY